MLRKVIGLLLALSIGSQIASGLQCAPGETITFERVTGLVPIIALETVLVHIEPGPQSLINECTRRCIEVGNTCVAFVLDYHQSSCFNVNATRSDNPTLFTPQPADYYEKICVKASQCGQVGAMTERVPGFELRALQSLAVLENVFTRSACASACINSTLGCRSALYDLPWGKCILIGEDRRSLPSAFVPSTMAVDYLENLCLDIQKHSEQICSFEEFHNVALIASDIFLPDMNFDKCRKRCDQEKTFMCRGFTLEGKNCSLHSADLASLGPEALLFREGATYFERAPCLDLLIRCSQGLITARLQTTEPFFGRLFVRGQSNKCDVTGQGEKETTLSVGNKCAQFGDSDVSVSLVVQYNPILQRRGDRALNVSCGYGDSLLTAVNGSIAVHGDPFMGGAITVNSSSLHTSSAVRILITDREGREASITEVGKELELRITAVNTEPFDVAAGKLVASNIEGTESVLLLDERGCPADPATFPALTKETDTGDLVAHFRAFRFTDTTIVRFHVRIHFCQGSCPPVDCGGKLVSYGRRRRDTVSEEIPGVAPKGRAIVWTDQSIINPRGSHPHDLETDILVFGPQPIVFPINLTSTEPSNIIFTTKSFGDEDGQLLEGWCVTRDVFLGVLIGWILMQIMLAIAIWTAATLHVQRASNVKLRNVRWKDDSAFD